MSSTLQKFLPFVTSLTMCLVTLQVTNAALSIDDAVNAMCPIGNEPIDGSTYVTYAGKTVGFCCPGCDTRFLAWSTERKDAFVAAAIAAGGAGVEVTTPPIVVDPELGEPYPLATCPVSGEPLGAMGDPVIKTYEGREIRLCCKGCIKKFEADKDAYLKTIDEQIIKDQTRYYPADKCVVSGEPLAEDGKDIAINVVYGNRLVRLCCKMCLEDFTRDPAKFLERLNKATMRAQRDAYPLETCVVAGGELGSMGEPTEMVIASRLLRFCCGGCEKKVTTNPSKYIDVIDKAWQTQGKYVPETAGIHDR